MATVQTVWQGWSMLLEIAVLTFFPALMIFAGSMDLLTMTIPNRIPLALAAVFACMVPLSGLAWSEVGLHAAVAAAALLAGIICFARGWIGGGDAKLFAAAALWFGPHHILEYTMLAAILGGVLTLFILFGRRIPLPAGLVRQEWLARLHDAGTGVPYGLALSAAALLVYPETFWMALR
jgi:prepilin peptidase CpaA